MEAVNFLAQLWGFCLIIICLSFLVKPKHVKNVIAVAENETALLFLGLLNVLLGVASLLAYNVWDKNWEVLITMFGWLMVAKGVLYLFAPETVVKMITKWRKNYMQWFPAGLVVGVLLGCALVYLGQMV